MSFFKSTVAGVFAAVALSYAQPAFAKAKIVEIDAPGAGTKPYDGTALYALNSNGDSAVYVRNGTAATGFVRKADGSFISFNSDAEVLPHSINTDGMTTGGV